MNQDFHLGVSHGTPTTQRGNNKGLNKHTDIGRKIRIIGLFQPLISFIYGLVIGGVKGSSYIKMME
ncbi:hypothetical protein [Trichormus azollae]|uniref:hypothetical protein n=1 Tax=Trichormus azollae TaxID=1164 RepID=UPI00325E7FCF